MKKQTDESNRDLVVNETRPKDFIRSLLPALATSLEDQAVAYYFHQHVIPPVEIIEPAEEHTSLIPLLWTQMAKDSTLHLAILAMSHSAFGNARTNSEALKASRAIYLRSISMLKNSLENAKDCCSDQILLATMLLSSYEVIDLMPL